MVIFYSYVKLPEGRLQIFWIIFHVTTIKTIQTWFQSPDVMRGDSPLNGGAIYIGPWNEEASEEVDLVAHPT